MGSPAKNWSKLLTRRTLPALTYWPRDCRTMRSLLRQSFDTAQLKADGWHDVGTD